MHGQQNIKQTLMSGRILLILQNMNFRKNLISISEVLTSQQTDVVNIGASLDISKCTNIKPRCINKHGRLHKCRTLILFQLNFVASTDIHAPLQHIHSPDAVFTFVTVTSVADPKIECTTGTTSKKYMLSRNNQQDATL